MDRDALLNAGCANLELFEALFEAYRSDPARLDRSWQNLFRDLEPQGEYLGRADPGGCRQAYRTYGHLMASIDPLAMKAPEEPPELKRVDGPDELTQALRATYCGKIGVEYKGSEEVLEQWLEQHIEPTLNQPAFSEREKKRILQQLNKAELLESFLHTKYVGQKRFSLEGAETLIPMLHTLVEKAVEGGVEELVIGMAHRGRLNVLCNIFQKSYAEIFAEFDERYQPVGKEGSGDVKYHKGFKAEFVTEEGKKMRLDLAPNPSHLESVDPVVEGLTRAKQDLRGDERRERVIPLLIHGDASLAGQGVIYETLQMNKLQGYATGGTLHIVLNNQIGFTTVPGEGRSTHYCTAIARSFDMPVFHVNAEDPEGCVYVILLALEMRQKFHCDIFIDLNCYRKYGHNEGDEPAFTQPLIYQQIRQKRSIRHLYIDALISEGVIEKQAAESLETEFKLALNEALKESNLQEFKPPVRQEALLPRQERIATAVDKSLLQQVAQRFCEVPPGFHLHPKILQLAAERLSMVKGEKPLDWGMAETLAYATLLWEGKSVRIAGQDCCRGTFSHRHSLWIDQETEKSYFPLQHLKEKQGRFEIYNSPLSENAALGFEFGYSVAAKENLVIWEAQFGDFSNGAQVVIDQFIVPSEQKWGQRASLVLFLPHGYEGQGPEHSSGRLERFLSLAGDENIQVIYPTTPAQLFHLLRRQVLQQIFKPLIVFTPKGLLRHPDCVNRLEDLTQGHFNRILDDPTPPRNPQTLVLCSGRLYYDLAKARAERQAKETAIVRLEELYPFPSDPLRELLAKYRGVREVLWAQEEPANMGAWEYLRAPLQSLLPAQTPLRYAGRARSAATAVGAHALHDQEQTAILEAVFNPAVEAQ